MFFSCSFFGRPMFGRRFFGSALFVVHFSGRVFFANQAVLSFCRNWNKEVEKSDNKKRKPSLLRAIAKTFWADYLYLAVILTFCGIFP